MTREEAIEVLKEISATLKSWSGFTSYPQAIDMAIEALHREEAEEKGYCHRINYTPKPCENANCDCVDVVRCKDCIHYEKHEAWSACTYWSGDPYEQASVIDEDFCSYGERRKT